MNSISFEISTLISSIKILNVTLKSYVNCTLSMSQLIKEPTRITSHSETLLDLCMDEISQPGVVRCGISDHDGVYMVRRYFRVNRHRTARKRCLKHFNRQHVVSLGIISKTEANPNFKWDKWKTMYLDALEKHVPLERADCVTKRLLVSCTKYIVYSDRLEYIC